MPESSSIPLPQPKSETREAFHKRITKALLRYALRQANTKVIVLLGHLRSGKSSLFEALTGQEGHSANGIDPVTKEYRLGHAHINGEFYLFVDTPGLNETGGNNADILREIGRFLDATKDSVTYAGLLYIHPAAAQFSDEFQRGLEFLEHFCGLEYSPHITFVTTVWDEYNDEARERHIENVEQIQERKWAPFIARGAEVYHHGRVYENGEPTLACLPIKKQAAERRACARDMIGRVYSKDKDYTIPPLIVQELRAHVPLHDTTAGRYLQMTYDEVAISNALTYGAGRLTATEGAAPPKTDEGSKDNDGWGFDWIGSAINAVADAITFPFRVMQTLLTMLWDLIRMLRMTIPIVGVAPHRITGNAVEVRVTLLGGLLTIVGFKRPGGFYWRARDSVEDNPADGPDSEFLNDVLNELQRDSEDGFDREGFTKTDPSRPPAPDEELDSEEQYKAFGEAFKHSCSKLEQNQDAQRGGGCSIM